MRGLGAPRDIAFPTSLLMGLLFSNSVAVRRAAQQYGLREGGEGDDWTLYWTDYSVSLERVMEMKSYQVSGSGLVLSGSVASPLWGPTLGTLSPGELLGTPRGAVVHAFPLPPQKINHFPGMAEICRKDLLARNMSRMFKMFPKDFHFFPRTWCLPAE